MYGDLNEVQPIDAYVRDLLKRAKEKYGLDIDLENPTRGQRLEAAVAMKDELHGFYSMEIMVGRRVDASEPITYLLYIQAMFPEDPRKFYAGFAHQYWPEK